MSERDDPIGSAIDGAAPVTGADQAAAGGAKAASAPISLHEKRQARAGRRGRGAGDGAAVPNVELRGDGLPVDCPVEPLGVLGRAYYYLDALRQLSCLPANEHSRLNLQALFGDRVGLLYDWHPRITKEGHVESWRPERVAEALMVACARAGVWDVFGRVRGPGAWLGEDGGLVLHAGDQILEVPGRPPRGPDGATWLVREPGRIGERVYPAAPRGPMPDQRRQPAGPDGPGQAALALLATWRWERGDIDARLLLGWIACAMIGGALKWRPLAWVTGDKGTGKSTLHDVIKGLLGGDRAVISVSDVSAAGIWQKLGHASLPVAVDELEADEDNRRTLNVIKLARQASSGGVIMRGGADHTASEFIARSCFLFSSILVPPLQSQDKSRMAMLSLHDLPPGQAPPKLDPASLIALGARCRRRLIDGWHRLPEVLEIYRAQLAAAGHGGRGSDQFGTLLAAADLVLHDALPSGDELGSLTAQLGATDLAERDDDARDHERCLAHLLTSMPDYLWRSGRRQAIAGLIATAAGAHPARAASWDAIDREAAERDAAEALALAGLRVVRVDATRYLAVANAHQGLAGVYSGTQWAGRSGTSGVWVQALRRIDGARWGQGCNLRIGAVRARCTLVPLDACLVGEEAPRPDAAGGIAID